MKGPSDPALLSLIFAPGLRPDAAALAAIGADPAASGFAVTLNGTGENGLWVELLASGLAFDCLGLAPGPSAAMPAATTLLGLPAAPKGEAITLQPGPHVASEAALQPVIRILLALAVDLARLHGVQAICWHPAECWMAPDYFGRIVADWLGGGAFPALGLIALARDDAGGLVTKGLSFFVDQELALGSDLGLTDAAGARLAIRVIDTLMALGPVIEPRALELAGQPPVLLVPDRSGARLAVMPPLHVR